MSEGRKLKFVPEEHTDFFFRVESSPRFVQFMARLFKPFFVAAFRIWLWLQYRRVKSRRTT